GADMRDIAGPVTVARRDFTLVYIALGLVILGVATVAVIGGGRLRGRRTAVSMEAPRPGAEREALERLDALAASGALAAADRKPAYLTMSEIVRAYLGRRFGIAARD